MTITTHEPLTVTLGSSGVTPEDVVAVARHNAKVTVAKDALDNVAKVRAHINSLAHSETPAYGISTGFGALANRHIPNELRTQLQKSLIRSHAAGMGPAVEREVVRGSMFLRAKTLASGRTGVRPVVLQTMVDVLNAGITPVVREFGSLGCSGDLAPLSHCALVLMGEGEAEGPDGVRYGGRGERPVAELLAEHGIEPVTLAEKEGLALVNGTEGMLGMLLMAIADIRKLLTTADITAAMSVEALLGTDQVFLPELHAALRPHPGQAASADNMLRVLSDSPIVASHRFGDSEVQDAYSLRCAPQVHGAARDTVDHAATVAGRELAAAIDNPVVLPDGRVSSNGNFHGAPVAYVLDFLAIAVADLSSIAERRTDRMLDPAPLARPAGLSGGRPRCLLWPDDRAVHAGRPGQRAQAARGAGQRRLDPELGDAGGPRLDGLARRPQTAPGGGEPAPGPGDRTDHQRACHRYPHPVVGRRAVSRFGGYGRHRCPARAR
ncbi:MAG: hypothetical protein NVS1B16_07360 [Pseudarthrobacter sp.]